MTTSSPYKSRFWLDLTTEAFRTRDMSRTIAILPVAAVEQHGPHLPVGVDVQIAQGYLDRVMSRIPDDLDVLFLPLQTVGKSNEHISFPGTLTCSAETLIRAWCEIGESVLRAGCRKLIFVNSHGGNASILDIVARELRVKHDMLAVVCAWHRLGYPEGAFSADELQHGIHGGQVETSLMLAFRPDVVDMEKAENFEPRTLEMTETMTHLRAIQPVGFGWMAQDLHPQGAIGDATIADAKLGHETAIFGADAFIELLRDVDRFELFGSSPAAD